MAFRRFSINTSSTLEIDHNNYPRLRNNTLKLHRLVGIPRTNSGICHPLRQYQYIGKRNSQLRYT